MEKNKNKPSSEFMDEEIPNPFEDDFETSETNPLPEETHRNRKRRRHAEFVPVTWASVEQTLSDVTWLWENFVPNGFCTMIASPSGVGKSYLLLHIVKTFLEGGVWPDDTEAFPSDKNVLWVEAESAQAMNIMRARNIDIDRSRIYAPLSDALDDFNIENENHCKKFDKLIQSDEVGLVIVDSLSGLHNLEENSTKVLQVIKYFSNWAKRTNKPIIISHHMKKDGEGLSGLRGSSAIVQEPRLVMELIAYDDVRKLQVVKNSFGIFPDPIQVVIDEQGLSFDKWDSSEWDEEPEAKIITEVEKAIEFLTSRLSVSEVPANILFQEAHELEISESSLNRAKKMMRFKSVRRADGWHWPKLESQEVEQDDTEDPFLL